MAANLDTLGNHCIDAAPLEDARFGNRRCTRVDEDAGGFDRLDDHLIG